MNRSRIIILRISLSVFVVLSISFPFFNRFFLLPREWKQRCQKEVKGKIGAASHIIEESFCMCLLEEFSAVYGSPIAFPKGRYEYNKKDYKIFIECLGKTVIPIEDREMFQNKSDYLLREIMRKDSIDKLNI